MVWWGTFSQGIHLSVGLLAYGIAHHNLMQSLYCNAVRAHQLTERKTWAFSSSLSVTMMICAVIIIRIAW